MTLYFLIKYFHVLGAIVILGTGTGIAFFMLMAHRTNDVARTGYATTPNVPLQVGLLGVSIPAGDRNKLPTFLYLWQPDPSMERMAGK